MKTPKMNELEEMISFCKKNKEIYIYGHDTVQKMISKYLYYSEISISGFIMPEIRECDRINEPFDIINLPELRRKMNKKKIGVIISTEDSLYNQVIETLKIVGGIKILFS